jgi:hypothetical protein
MLNDYQLLSLTDEAEEHGQDLIEVLHDPCATCEEEEVIELELHETLAQAADQLPGAVETRAPSLFGWLLREQERGNDGNLVGHHQNCVALRRPEDCREGERSGKDA